MKFMVSTGFQGSTEERNALIPQEQAQINALKEQGIVEALYISAETKCAGESAIISINLNPCVTVRCSLVMLSVAKHLATLSMTKVEEDDSGEKMLTKKPFIRYIISVQIFSTLIICI